VAWENDWGGLYKPGAPKGYAARIAQLEAQLKRYETSAILFRSLALSIDVG
jgi:hypothetical protein